MSHILRACCRPGRAVAFPNPIQSTMSGTRFGTTVGKLGKPHRHTYAGDRNRLELCNPPVATAQQRAAVDHAVCHAIDSVAHASFLTWPREATGTKLEVGKSEPSRANATTAVRAAEDAAFGGMLPRPSVEGKRRLLLYARVTTTTDKKEHAHASTRTTAKAFGVYFKRESGDRQRGSSPFPYARVACTCGRGGSKSRRECPRIDTPSDWRLALQLGLTMMTRARQAVVFLVLAVLTTTDVIPGVGAFNGGLRAGRIQPLPHHCSDAASSSVSPRHRLSATSTSPNPAGDFWM